MRQHVVIAVLLCCTGSAAFGEAALLTSDEIKILIGGATVRVDTPFGMQLPVQYNSNGQISGDAGGMAGFLGSPSDHGRWWVENDRLCHKWSRWFDREVQCLTIARDGQRLFWSRDDGQKGTATLIAEIQPGDKAPFALGAADATPAALAAPAAAPAEATRTPPPAAEKAASAQVRSRPKPTATVRTAGAATVVVATPKPSANTPVAPKRATVASAGVSVPSFRITGVAANDVLHIRQRPLATSAVIGDLAPQSQGLRLTGACVGEWCPVTHKGVSGWVGKHYLAEEIAAVGPVRR